MPDYISNHSGEDVDNAITKIKNLIDIVYPVGSIYISVNNVSPATFIGGTWEQINEKFLLAGSSTNYPYGSTGGAATVTLTASQMPKHGHGVYVWDNAGTTGNAWFYNASGTQTTHAGARLYNASASTWIASGSTAAAAGSGRGDPSGGTSLSGGGAAHNNMPPYLSVYMWKRTA